jgi:protein-S-isoprenylcysteine O-methyltransferase Ste14
VAAVAADPALHLLDAPGRFGAIDGLAVNGVGSVLLAAGAVVALVAQHQMGPAWRAGIDVTGRDELAVDGLFRFVRNPFYSGMLTASLGVTLMAPNLASVAGWLAILAGCVIDVRLIEEPHLRIAHGETYADYERSTTPRFLP